MLLNSKQFKDKLAQNKLTISIVGMSNIGKTFWSKSLNQIGFNHICCDDLIEEKLEPELKSLGYKGLADVAKWMGHPYENHFPQTQSRYLDFENQTMSEIFTQRHEQNTIIDTTGSVIYTNPQVTTDLKNLSLIIYIQAPETMIDRMFENFLKHPKPIIWGENFQKQTEQTNEEALAQCYPELLKYRAEKYAKLADITIPYEELNYKMSPQEFLNKIHATL